MQVKRVHLSPPDVGELEHEYVLAALRSGWIAPVGPDLDAFEREMAARVGARHALAVSSGTAGLHLTLLALGVGVDQVVVVPTLTFVATANAVTYTGAEPVFVDCDPSTGNIDVDLLRELLETLRAEGRRIGAVMAVDMFGACADYDALAPLCSSYDVPIVEDAAEALGAARAGQPAGSFGRAGVLSFNGNKMMTTSSGGMIVSDDTDLVARCRYFASQARAPVPHYEHADVGYNYRLSNLLAALGRAQLRRLDGMLARRQALRERYAKVFAQAEGVRLLADDDMGANCWLTTILVEPAQAGWEARDLADWLAVRNIETRRVWKPMHLQPVFSGARAVLTGAAQRLFETGLALPSGSVMNEEDVTRVVEAISEFLQSRRMPKPLLASAGLAGGRPS